MEGSTYVLPTEKHKGMPEAIQSVLDIFPRLPNESLVYLKHICEIGGIDGSKRESGVLATLTFGSGEYLDEDGSSTEVLIQRFFRWKGVHISEDFKDHPLEKFFLTVRPNDTVKDSSKLRLLHMWCTRNIRTRPSEEEESLAIDV